MIKIEKQNVSVEPKAGVIRSDAALYLAEIIISEFRHNRELQRAFEEWKKSPEAARFA